jgi:transposase InsO family protein
MSSDRSEQIALSRFSAISALVGQGLESAERRQLLRQLSLLDHEQPDGEWRRYSRETLRRWLRDYQERGLEGLRPRPRRDRGQIREHAELIEEACRLRRELPERSADQIARIMQLRTGIWVPPRSIRRHLSQRGLRRAELITTETVANVFGRFQAEHPNELWIADFLDGPPLPYPPRPGSHRKTHLLLLLDDYSRLIVHARWVLREDARTAQLVFRQALIARGRPSALYVDRGAAFVSAALRRTCAVLGIRLIHSAPNRPQGRGKTERVLGTVNRQFLIEAKLERIDALSQLNDLFDGWAQAAYHQQAHSETGEAPLARFLAHAHPEQVSTELLFDAFRWSVQRLVDSTAHVSLCGNRYEVDAALAGRKAELRFEPEDMSRVEVWYEDRCYGTARPFDLKRHTHPRLLKPPAIPAPSDTTSQANPSPSYLAQLQARYEREHFGHIDYRPATRNQEDRP